ncbi:flagellar motor switch protein FliN [Candidatus Fukatsuia symbiotica]|uniref:Flagellar motor switch protein FliN n=1 Tax=Candidatus Fukatsuia symbiotica TaxID=1878942 RepID=A0A2U8I955_9GAMM|nr:flagellar motor switch protein FliN [Candidatus Fukatsuia symbiotica]AWK14605.1 flagellar motor switch protein FliN [Candidatus Fukatsuia symbiotica]MEA9444913.1 flagellar motor switch protein FliN [Candidatus Fukatsuia symbiotica]
MTDEQKELNADLDLDLDFTLDQIADSESSDVDAVEPQQNTVTESAVAKSALAEKARNMSLFNRIPVALTLEVASVELSLAELMSINTQSIVELDKPAGEPLDIKVNGILFGKAEVVVLNDKYGLRIIELNNQNLGELAL